MNLRSTNACTIQDTCVKKAIVNCTLENVLIYFRIRAQVAYILI